MSGKRTRLVDETPEHYVMHDGVAPFRVPKAGLSDAMHQKIQAMADGGRVEKPHIKGKILSETTTQDPNPEKPHIQGRIISETTTYPEPEKPHTKGRILSETTIPEERRPVDADELSQLSVSRWRGGEIPARGYADGGGVDDLPMMRDPGPSVVSIPMGTAGGVPGPVDINPAVYVPPEPIAPPAPDPGLDLAALPGMPGREIPGSMDWYNKHAKEGVEAAAVKELDKRKMGEQVKGALERVGQDAGASAAPPVAPARPAGVPGVRVPGAPAMSPDEEIGAIEAQKRLAAQEGDIKAKALEAQAEAAKATAQGLADWQKQRQQQAEQARQMTDRAMAQHQAIADDMARTDMTVDPGRYWATRSTGGKIAGIIGLALGAIGAGGDGINRAAGLINQAIDRDLDAQKSEHELRMRKGQAALAASQTAYGMMRNRISDDSAALDASKAALLDIAAAKAKAIADSTAAPLARNQALGLVASLTEKSAQYKQGLQQKTFDNQMKQTERAQEAQKIGLEAQKVGIEAVKAEKAGSALSNEEKSKVYDVEATTRNIRRNIARAKDLIKAYGTYEAFGAGGTELKRAIGDIAQDTARLMDPGSTVKEGELAEAKKKLGVEGGELFTSNETAMKLLDSFEQGIEERRGTALRVRGIRP